MLSPTVISNPGLYHAWQIAGAEQNEKPRPLGPGRSSQPGLMSARATTLAQPVAGIQPGVQATARAGRRRARKARPALGLTGQVLSRGRSIKHLTNARRCGRFRGSWRRAGATGNEKAPACGPGRSPKSDVVLTDTKSMRGVRHGSGGGGSAMKNPGQG